MPVYYYAGVIWCMQEAVGAGTLSAQASTRFVQHLTQEAAANRGKGDVPCVQMCYHQVFANLAKAHLLSSLPTKPDCGCPLVPMSQSVRLSPLESR
jgi:hypothetical protein